jgi:N-methylhydantoinase A/oxoprolinase/acetone carboxylase beta subunit
MSTEDCARGILRVANAEMVRALRVMSVERGLDPRGFALLAFGGAGPLHAAAIAEELGIQRILVPRASGVLSALGLAAADRRATHQRSVFLDAREHGADDRLGSLRAELIRQAHATLGVGVSLTEATFDVRYRGQSHELAVKESGEPLRAAGIAEHFEDEHERRYGWREPQTPVEIVNVRLSAIDPGPRIDLAHGADEALRPLTGPAVLRLEETTVAVPAGWSGTPDATGTLFLERRS